ncbi:MAG: helix-turn-helix domain-containing protein [Lachnospiraceae bacterium]
MDNNYNIGDKIKQYRHARGFSQEELAFRANISSVYLRQIEKNYKNPTTVTIFNLCKALSISPASLFDDDISVPPSTTEQQILAFLSNKTENEKKIALEILKTAFKLDPKQN